MARDISIAYAARDQISPAINSMRNSNRLFNKDLEETQRQIDVLNKRQDSLSEGLAKSRRRFDETSEALKQAKKYFEDYGDTLGKDYLSNFYRNHAEASEQLKDFESTIRSTRKEVSNLSNDMNRADNRSGGMMRSLANAGLFKMAGDSVSGMVNMGIGSAFGSAMGDAIGNTLSGAFSGAAMGSIAGPAGAAIGAAVGTVAGGITAATGYIQKEEEEYKSIRYHLVKSAIAQTKADLESGIGIAAGRQLDEMAFTTMIGSETEAKEFLNTLRAMDRNNPFSYDDMTSISRILKAFRFGNDDILGMLNSIGDAGAGLGMQPSDMQMVARAIGRMSNSATATRIDLDVLSDRGINAVGYLAQAGGISIEEAYAAVSAGEIPGNKAAQVIQDYMAADPTFKGMMKTMSASFTGLQSRIEASENEMRNAFGVGYMEERDKGMLQQALWMEGDKGGIMQEANQAIGQWYASLDNEREQIEREYVGKALGSTAYEEAIAKEDGAEAGRIVAQAQIDAQIAYAKTEGAKQLAEMEKRMIQSTGDSLKDSPELFQSSFEIGQEYSKGFVSGFGETLEADMRGIISKLALSDNGGEKALAAYLQQEGGIHGNAWGIPRVPYDNYLTVLHQDEQVLTASEARNRNSPQTSVTITGNDFHVRQESDIDAIADAIITRITHASQVST